MKGNDMNRKFEYYLNNKIKIHIICSNGIFYNGMILDLTSNKDLLILKDDKLGEVPILFEEIERVEPFREVRE